MWETSFTIADTLFVTVCQGAPKTKKPVENQRGLSNCAEEEGFEPPVPYSTLVFKTSAFDHSATPLFCESECKCSSSNYSCKSQLHIF